MLHNDTTTCVVCKLGYYVDNTTPANCINTFIESYGENNLFCSGSNDNTSLGTCKYCDLDNGYYLTYSQKCCKQGEYWNATNKLCEPMDFSEDQYYCSQFTETVDCQKCDNSQNFFLAYKPTFKCCPKNYYYDSTLLSCSNRFSQISSSYLQCNLFTYDQLNNL